MAPLADRLQVWGIEKGNIIFSDSTLGFALDVAPIDVSCADDNKLNALHDFLCQFLNGLPPHITVQFIQEIKSGNKSVLENYKNSALLTNDPLTHELASKRIDKYLELERHGGLPKHGLKILVRKQLSKPLVEKPKLFAKTKDFEKLSDDRLESELRSLNQIKDDICASLATCGLLALALDSETIIDELYKLWNPSRPVELEDYDPTDIRNSILFTDSVIDQRGFSLSNYHYRVISLKLLPSQTIATMAEGLRNLPFDSSLHVTIHVPDQQKEISALELNRRLAFSMVHGKTSGVSDLESEAKLDDLETLLSELIANGEKVFHFAMTVVLKSRDLDELEHQVSHTLMKFRELNGAEGMEETLAAFNIFCDVAFPNAKCLERTKRIKTSNLADLLPVYGPWRGHSEPKVLLRTRMGSLVSFNPFSSDLTNANQIISGGSGSGKSFLTNLLLMQMRKDQPHIFIVDIGGSYKKFCDNLSGQYVPMAMGTDITMNPFDLLEGEVNPSSPKLKFLLALVELMTKDDDKRSLGKLEKTGVEQAIQKVYLEYKTPTLSHLKDELKNSDEDELKRISKILSAWCGDTPFGRFLDRPTNVALSSQVVCWDLKGLESYPELQAVSLLMITDLVWRVVQKDRAKMKFLVFDECWRLLEGEGASFISETFRTFRKYYASCIGISQTMDDFARSSVAPALLANSSVKWVLRQKGSDKESLAQILDLNDAEISLISSLRQSRGDYSEAFLICEDNRAVVQIDCTPIEYWLATTDPRDLAKMEEEAKKQTDLPQLELLKKLAKEFPRGVASA